MTPETPPGGLGRRCWPSSGRECPKVSLTFSTTASGPAPAYPPTPELAWAEEVDLSRRWWAAEGPGPRLERARACEGTGRRESCPRPGPPVRAARSQTRNGEEGS